MSDDETARKLAQRAGGQAKNAAKNTGRAARAAAEPIIDATAEEIHDVADKVEDTAQEAVRKVRRVDPTILGRMSSQTGQGFMALSVAIWATAYAFNKFRNANADGAEILASAAKADHHIRPSE